jgi:ABC-type phosphate/phosphonate transport system substrate-binding protein
MLTRHRLLTAVATLGLLAPLLAQAGGRDFAVYATRLGGDAETAQPYIDKFASFLAESAGLSKGSLKGRFAGSKRELEAYQASQKPGFAIVDPSAFFEQRQALASEPLVEVQSADLNSLRYHVVVKDPAYKGLSDLAGKRLWTHLADWPRFLGSVVLDGKGEVGSRFALKQVGNATKAVRAVLRGEADAALLDDEQLESAKKLEGGASLKAIYSSPALPPLYVVAFGKGLADADKKALQKALPGVCTSPAGKEICQEMHIGKFLPIDAALLAATTKRFAGAGGGK